MGVRWMKLFSPPLEDRQMFTSSIVVYVLVFYAWLVTYPLFLKLSWMHVPGKMALVKLLQVQFPANSWQFCCLSVALLGKVLGSHTVSSNSEICTCMAATCSFRILLDVFDVTAAKFWSSWFYFNRKILCLAVPTSVLKKCCGILRSGFSNLAGARRKSPATSSICARYFSYSKFYYSNYTILFHQIVIWSFKL